MTRLDWIVVAFIIVLSIVAGIGVVRLASRNGAISFFTGDRNLPWWAIAISNTATYQSGSGGFVMLMLAYGLACNRLWWSAWIIRMPLVAIIWAPMWRRMRICEIPFRSGPRHCGQSAPADIRLHTIRHIKNNRIRPSFLSWVNVLVSGFTA
jgi:hypothetical protein